MIAYRILRTEKTRGYTESVFLETLCVIYAEAPGMGFFKHPTITTPAALAEHLQQMKKDGFRVVKTTLTVKA